MCVASPPTTLSQKVQPHRSTPPPTPDHFKALLEAGKGIEYVPIADGEGETALGLAIKKYDTASIKVLMEALTPFLSDTTSALMTADIRRLALTSPLLVPWALDLLETKVLHQVEVPNG